MYCIVVYDVQQRRVAKMLRLLRKYLFWIQNSVFEGEIRESNFFKMQQEIEKLIDKDKDSVIIFKFSTPKWMERKIIGKKKGENSRIITDE